jgi:type I toxin-antitoxin system toxin SymE
MNQQPQTPASKPSNKPRRLTVGYAHTDEPGVRVPNLRLCGRWLRAAGFVI